MSSIALLVGVVDAGATGVEEAVDFGFERGLEHVGVDEDREHAEGFVVFDEAHAAHVGGEIVDFADAVAGVAGRHRGA